MTEEELRELDRKVCGILGNHTVWEIDDCEGGIYSSTPEGDRKLPRGTHARLEFIYRYSQEWALLPEMLDWLIAKGWIVDLYYYQESLWQVAIKTQEEFARFRYVYYPTLPRAVCEAVLLAAQEAK